MEDLNYFEFIDFSKVDENFIGNSIEITSKIKNEMMRDESKRPNAIIEFFDEKGILRIPRAERHTFLVSYSACYSIFYYLFNFPGASFQVF